MFWPEFIFSHISINFIIWKYTFYETYLTRSDRRLLVQVESLDPESRLSNYKPRTSGIFGNFCRYKKQTTPWLIFSVRNNELESFFLSEENFSNNVFKLENKFNSKIEFSCSRTIIINCVTSVNNEDEHQFMEEASE